MTCVSGVDRSDPILNLHLTLNPIHNPNPHLNLSPPLTAPRDGSARRTQLDSLLFS